MSLSISGWRLLLDTWNPHITLTFILIHICLLKAVMISLQVGVLWGRKTVFNACTYKYSNQCCFSATWLLLVMPRFESNGMDGLSACHSFQVAPRFYVYNVLRNFICFTSGFNAEYLGEPFWELQPWHWEIPYIESTAKMPSMCSYRSALFTFKINICV